MKRKWLSLNVGAWIWMLAVSAQAFPLGAAKEEIVRRYGNPPEGSEVKDIGQYFWSGWELRIHYVQGCAQEITYRKIDPLSDADISTLLQQNAAGQNWNFDKIGAAGFRHWNRADWASAQWWSTSPRELKMTASPFPGKSPTLAASSPHPAASLAALSLSLRSTTPAQTLVFQPLSLPLSAAPSANFPNAGMGMLIFVAALIGLAARSLHPRKRSNLTVIPTRKRIGKELSPPPLDCSEALPDVASDGASEKSDGWHFELLMAEIYRRHGYEVEMMAADGPDDGVDIALQKGGERVLVQCKDWSNKVPVERVREFAAVVADQKANRGIFATTSSFTKEAIAFAERNGLQLIGGGDLDLLIGAVAQPGEDLWQVSGWIYHLAASVTLRDPWCPRCRGEMKIRKGRYGLFWGCTQFPRCDGKRKAREALLGDRRYMPT